MTLLQAIWWVSLWFAGLSLLLMAFLIVKRVFSDRRAARRARRKDEISSQVIVALDKDGPSGLEIRSREESEIFGEIVHDLLNVLRGDAVDRLNEIVRDSGAIDYFIRDLGQSDGAHQLTAIRNLSLFDDPRIFDRLWNLAGNAESGNIRLSAAFALLKFEVEVDVPKLVDRLQIGTVTTTAGLRGFFKRIGANRPNDLKIILEATQIERVKILCLIGLRESRDFQFVDTVADFVHDASKNVRAEAVRALGVLDHPKAKEFVLNALSDEAWEVRNQAAVAVGRIGLREGIPGLTGLLTDPHWWVKFRAAEALVKLDEEGIAALTDAGKADSNVAELAKLTLSEFAANSP